MKKFSMMITLAFLISGCALFGGVAEKVAEGIEKYCEEPYSQRLVYHEQVNNELLPEGHSIEIICAGDPEDVDDATSQIDTIQTKPATNGASNWPRSIAVQISNSHTPITHTSGTACTQSSEVNYGHKKTISGFSKGPCETEKEARS